jgi:hypothetical protein
VEGPLLPGEVRPITPRDLLAPDLEAFAHQIRVCRLMALSLIAQLPAEDDLTAELAWVVQVLGGD